MHKFTREDLQLQYENDPNFRKKVNQSERDYANILVKAQSSGEWQKTINDSMFQPFMTEDDHTVYFFYGFLQPPPGRKKISFMFHFLMNFRPDPEKQYSFVYFNQKTPSSEYYFEFESIFSLLPISILQKLKNFILVKPYLYIKAWEYVSFVHKIFQKHYETMDSTPDVLKKLKITPHEFVQFVPEEISQEFPSHFKRKPSLATYRINFQGQLMSQQQLKDRRDFQNTIKALFTKQVYRLQNYQLGEIGIPIILQVLINYFKAKPEGLKIEGIFRKSVSLDEQTEIMEQLSQRNYDYIINNVGNPHIVACLIKKFFNNLKEPIIPFRLFEQLMQDQQAPNKKQYYKSLIKTLPPLNSLTLTFLIEFLKKDVIIHQKESKMNTHNIAICFSPSLMRSQKPSMADLVFAQKSVTLTEMLIVDFDDFFGDDDTRSKIFQKSMISRKKDFKKTIRQQLNLSQDLRQSEQDQQLTVSKRQETLPKETQKPKNEQVASKKPQLHQENVNMTKKLGQVSQISASQKHEEAMNLLIHNQFSEKIQIVGQQQQEHHEVKESMRRKMIDKMIRNSREVLNQKQKKEDQQFVDVTEHVAEVIPGGTSGRGQADK